MKITKDTKIDTRLSELIDFVNDKRFLSEDWNVTKKNVRQALFVAGINASVKFNITYFTNLLMAPQYNYSKQNFIESLVDIMQRNKII